MIYAVKHNKVDRNLYKANEDSLTASVFERLMYLPKELFQYILENALFDVVPFLDLRTMESVEYWPNWSADNTSNSNKVEPDIFIRTSKADIIIETKRYDKNQQDHGQWMNQVVAYRNEYTEDQKELVYIALGGLRNKRTETFSDKTLNINVYKCSWARLLEAVKEALLRIEHSTSLVNNTHAIRNILADIIMCFGMYGYATADWLERFIKPSNIGSRSLREIQELNNIDKWKN